MPNSNKPDKHTDLSNKIVVFSGAQVNIVENGGHITVNQTVMGETVFNTPQKKLTPSPVKNSCFIGRKNEENTITKLLNSEKMVVLNGIGGIGKTALAKHIYFEAEKNYDYVAWIDYQTSLITSLINSTFKSYLPFKNSDSEQIKYEYIFQLLTNLNGKMLIIVDNFNSVNSGELSELAKLSADILITSRCHIDGVFQYNLDLLSKEECVKLFKDNYKYNSHLTYKDDMAIYEIVEKSQRYTLAIELIAKSFSYKGISITDGLAELRKVNYQLNGLNLSADSDWNDPFRNENIALQLGKVYKISDLNRNEQILIGLISILPPFSTIQLSDLKKWVTFECQEYVFSLASRGWIIRGIHSIQMHEIVCSSIYKYNHISYDCCKLLLNDLQENLKLGPKVDTLQCVKYAEYTLNIIELKKKEERFCQHVAAREAALIFKEIGKYQISKRMLDIIITSYDENNAANSMILAELYNNYSKIFSMESNIKEAIEKSKKAECLIDSIRDDNSKEYFFQKMIIKKTVGMHYSHLKNNDVALKKLQEAIECSDKIDKKNKFHIANLYSDYSLLLSDMGSIQKSVDNYRECIHLYDEYKIVSDSSWRNTTYTNYADSLIQNNQLPEAIFYEYQALIGKYQTYQNDNLAIANALMGMGHIYRAENRLWDIASVFYQKAADIYKKNSPLSDGYCDAIACLSIVNQQYDLALEAYTIINNNISNNYYIPTYVDIMCSLKEQFPEEMIKIGEIALSKLKTIDCVHEAEQYICALIGEAYHTKGKKDKAEEFFKRSILKSANEKCVYYIEAKKIIDNTPSMIG